MKISFVQTFLLVAVAILGVATAETQKLRGANVEKLIADVAELKNERGLQSSSEISTNFNTNIDELVLDFNIGTLFDFLFSFGNFNFNFNFFFFEGGFF